MADETTRAREPFEEYCDAFTVSITPFGANLSFSLREAHPSTAKQPRIEHLGTIRMSVEHLKTMVMMIRRQIIQAERDTGVHVEVPSNLLNQLGIAPEDWDQFWKTT